MVLPYLRARTRRLAMFGPYMPVLLVAMSLQEVDLTRCPLLFQILVSGGAGAIGIGMPLGVYILASLLSGVSAALILAGSPSYTDARSFQGSTHNDKQRRSTHNRCRVEPCQVAYLNSVEDFCLWAPLRPGLSPTGDTEHTVVAWCTKSVHGARVIPDGTISGARLVITPGYIQIAGVGNLTHINVPADGIASASGEGDRARSLVSTRAYGQLEQIYDWTSFVSQELFCFRACKPSAAASCLRIYDGSACSEDVPGNDDARVFADRVKDAPAPPPMHQQVLAASSHSTGLPSGCTTRSTTRNAQVARARRDVESVSSSAPSTSTSSTVPAPTDTPMAIPLLSFAASTSTTTFMNSSMPVPSITPTSPPHPSTYTHNRTLSHAHSHSYNHSHHHSTPSVLSRSPHHSFNHSRSSRTAVAPSWLGDPATISPTISPASLTPVVTSIFSTNSLSIPSSSAAPTVISTPTSSILMPTSTSSFSFTSDGTSSSPSEPSSRQPSSSTPSSTASPTTSPAPPPVASSPSSQSSDVLTSTASPSSSSRAHPSSSATSTSTLPNSQTQLSSQCPPPSQVAGNPRSAVPPPISLLSFMLAILMVALSSSVPVLIP